MPCNVYINDLAAFLPNEPVTNRDIEEVLGKIKDIPSSTKEKMLANNKIEKRYYAIDPATKKFTHTNAQLTAEAVRRLKPHDDFSLNEIETLCCGTTSPDLLMPGHALMVLGELGMEPCEAVSTSGICLSGMAAFKYGYLSIAGGNTENAVVTGSELASSFMRAEFFTPSVDPLADISNQPILAFNADFLRWMLSDGAGAAALSNKPSENGPSLRIDWIDSLSFSGEFPTCMYAGGRQNEDGSITGWRESDSALDAARENLMAVKQDTGLLGDQIVKTMGRTLTHVMEKHGLAPRSVDWFLPHYSSHYFRDKFYMEMKRVGFEVPYERWFTNLPYTGNMGSASIYVIMEEIFKSGRLKHGERILCFIPESGRFAHCFMQLTVI